MRGEEYFFRLFHYRDETFDRFWCFYTVRIDNTKNTRIRRVSGRRSSKNFLASWVDECDLEDIIRFKIHSGYYEVDKKTPLFSEIKSKVLIFQDSKIQSRVTSEEMLRDEEIKPSQVCSSLIQNTKDNYGNRTGTVSFFDENEVLLGKRSLELKDTIFAHLLKTKNATPIGFDKDGNPNHFLWEPK